MQSAQFPSVLMRPDAQNPKCALSSSLSYLADGAVVEEEEGADEGAQGAGDDVGAQPLQDAAQLRRGVPAGHHQGRAPSCQLEVLHGRRWPLSKASTMIPSGFASNANAEAAPPPEGPSQLKAIKGPAALLLGLPRVVQHH